MSWGEAKWIVNQIPIVPGPITPGDDNLTTVLSGTFTQSNNSSKVIGNFTIPAEITGKVRFKATLKTSSASTASVFAITDTTSTFFSGNINTVTNMRGYVTTTSTTGEMVHLDLNVTAGETLYFQICGMGTNNTTLTNITMSYDTPNVVSAKISSPIQTVQQGYYSLGTPSTQDSTCDNTYYHSIKLTSPVSSNAIALFQSIGNGYIGGTGNSYNDPRWFGLGFARVVNRTDLRLYSPYGSNDSKYGGYWIVIDLNMEE